MLCVGAEYASCVAKLDLVVLYPDLTVCPPVCYLLGGSLVCTVTSVHGVVGFDQRQSELRYSISRISLLLMVGL